MNSKLFDFRPLLRLQWQRCILLMLLLAACGPISAQERQSYTIPMTYPDQPVILEADLVSGSITVIGENRNDVEVQVSATGSQRRIITPSGEKPIPIASYALDIEEEENHIDIDTEWGTGTVNLVVRVPHETNLDLDIVNDGDITVSDITGTLELENTNGAISATGIRGSVIAETINQDITIELLEVTPDTPMAFESNNGSIDLSLPGDFKGELRMASNQDEIYSEFDVEIRPTEPVFKRDQSGKRVEFKLDQKIIAVINGGGTPIMLETRQGTINIRKSR